MYTLIDELVETIVNDDVFIKYKQNNKLLEDDDLKKLVSKHQVIFEDYLRLKEYEKYVSIDETKKELLEVKKELSDHPFIQQYYQSYYALNDLLEEITNVVFMNISDDIITNRYK